MTPIYLDYNATTPVDDRVLAVMLPFLRGTFANPASDHIMGLEAKKAVEVARKEIAGLVRAKENEIIFTAGATESNNLAIFGLAKRFAGKKNHIISTKIEHPAVLEPLLKLEEEGYTVTLLDVDSHGRISLEDLKSKTTDNTFLISVMFVNNEIGTIQDIKEIGSIAKAAGVIFHTDAAQAVGHVDIDVDALNIDLLSISGHKFYAPKGVGALFVRNRIPRVVPDPIILGGGQERGYRSGTLNVPGIVGLGEAARLAKKERVMRLKKIKELAVKTRNGISAVFPKAIFHGHEHYRISHNISVELPGIDNKWLSLKLNQFCFSTGSACSTLHDKPSHVLISIGLPESRIKNCIRLGLGVDTSPQDIDAFIFSLSTVLKDII